MILYRENVVRINISQLVWLYGRSGKSCDEHFPTWPPLRRLRLQRIKAFEIQYDDVPYDGGAYESIDRRSSLACKLLAQLDNIRYLSLDLSAVVIQAARVQILQGWLMMRNVGHAVVKRPLSPIPISVSEEAMISRFWDHATTRSAVPRMYFALERYPQPIDYCDCLLHKARQYAMLDDLEGFKEVRAQIIARNKEAIKDAEDRMTEYDP